MEVTVARDWLDYVQASLTLLSLGLAGGAVWFARKSVDDASSAANSAHETVETSQAIAGHSQATAEHSAEMAKHAAESVALQREEHQAFIEAQNKKPDINVILELKSLETQNDGTTIATMRWGAVNVGTKTAENALMIILSSTSTQIQQCDSNGSHRRPVAVAVQTDHKVIVNGESVEAHSWNEDASLRPHIRETRTSALTFAEPGEYEIQVLVRHPEIESGSASASDTIRVPKVALQAPKS